MPITWKYIYLDSFIGILTDWFETAEYLVLFLVKYKITWINSVKYKKPAAG